MEIRKGKKKAMIHSTSPYKKQGGFLHHTLSLLPPVVPFFLSRGSRHQIKHNRDQVMARSLWSSNSSAGPCPHM